MQLLKVNFLASIVDGFSSEEYLIIFNAIIYGFITVSYFSGWGNMMQNRHRIIFSFEHLSWSVFAFINLVTGWYEFWYIIELINNNIWYLFLSLAPQFTSYLMVVLLFPSYERQANYKEYLKNNKVLLLLTYAAHMLIASVNSMIHGINTILDEQNIMRYSGILVCISAVFIKNKTYHTVIISLAYVMFILYLFTFKSIA